MAMWQRRLMRPDAASHAPIWPCSLMAVAEKMQKKFTRRGSWARNNNGWRGEKIICRMGQCFLVACPHNTTQEQRWIEFDCLPRAGLYTHEHDWLVATRCEYTNTRAPPACGPVCFACPLCMSLNASTPSAQCHSIDWNHNHPMIDGKWCITSLIDQSRNCMRELPATLCLLRSVWQSERHPPVTGRMQTCLQNAFCYVPKKTNMVVPCIFSHSFVCTGSVVHFWSVAWQCPYYYVMRSWMHRCTS